ncbi:DASH family cryptochrome [Portibacter lacus]|uniref:Cryptochrome DASH n=1 Tax=Portibacter lacus TaxID=1099794 RepID=A0AA37SMH5_9BACT|nr:DASH family cryptochrome [Portibacter lacus]GLR17408.1 cryptochrome DASH [Portibacter lacus]
MRKRGIVWFRSDLRLHDNEAIFEAINHVKELLYVYVFDERVFLGKTKYGFRKTEKYRSKFIIQSIHNLRQNLKERGCRLIVRVGKPELILPEICKESDSSWIFCNRERTSEEKYVQDELEKNLWSIGREVRFCRGKMLYYTSDLPFPITHTPDTFSAFRKEVEKFVPVRKPLPTADIEIPDSRFKIEDGEIPDLSDFGFTDEEQKFDPLLLGGESAGLHEMNYYLWDSNLVSTYKETRNGLLGRDYSSKFSAYLSAGCLSPKLVAHQVFSYEKERNKNESTYWLVYELMWRDFFRLMGKKYENSIFQLGGIQQRSDVNSEEDMEAFEKWSSGNTGVPFVDANMTELNETGFMSNRGRQNVASYLVNDMKLSWLLGASYFESLLIDYDPCSNYGNWNYIAGVGNDPRTDRYFNIETQAKKYDPEGMYIKKWS